MNILLLTPGINKKFNDNYFAYAHIAASGHRVLAVSNRQNILKGSGTELSPDTEEDGALSVHRVFDTLREQRGYFSSLRKYGAVRKLAEDFRTDIVFCENSINMPIAVKLKRELGIPLVLRLEDFYHPRDPYAIIGHSRFIRNRITGDLLGWLIASGVWSSFCRDADALITHNPSDKGAAARLRAKGLRARYIPWPGKEVSFGEPVPRQERRAAYIGSFDPHKNLSELAVTLPALFAQTPLEEFCIVGGGRDEAAVERLCALYPGKVRRWKTMPREDCLRLIAGSWFCYLPAHGGAWGFIGDCWAMRTPLVVTTNHYEFADGVDSVVATPRTIVERVNRLYGDRGYYAAVTEGGYRRFREHHSAEKVGEEYLDVCRSAMEAKGAR